jgi:hypothetical protein
MTSWAESIDTLHVLSEYPRPQMIRNEWLNLNGVWDFEKGVDFGAYQSNISYTKRILVPFPIESALSGITDGNYIDNIDKTFFYRRFFEIPEAYKNKDILLHFGAVDWECAVFVNGIQVGTHKGGYDPFSFNITAALTDADQQEIQVQVIDPSDKGGQPKGKQTGNPGGIYYTPVSGIWQTVWIEPVEEKHICDFTIIPDIDSESVFIRIESSIPDHNTKATVKLFDKNQLVSITENIQTGENIQIAVPNPKLWNPDHPFLYNLELELNNGNQTVDRVYSYFGMRKISKGLLNGAPCLMLNNRPIFHYGVLDQGYWPDGLYTAPSDEALLFDLQKTKAFGMNMTRKHAKVEPARWYYHCDTMGIMVWQDIPSALENGSLGNKEWIQNNFYREMGNIMKGLKNFPSIVTWVIFNEGWGQDGGVVDTHTRKAVEMAQQIDSTRLINSVSGWIDYEIGDIIDKHQYPHPALHINPINERVGVCGEYGGITLQINDHIWKGNGHQYVSVNNGEELKNLFINYVNNVQGLQQQGIWGAVYTQITDVEEEINGLITYDRKVIKVNSDQLSQINTSIKNTIEMHFVPLLETGDVSEECTWKYTFDFPGNNWIQPNFNDSSWEEGNAGFGAGSPPNTFIRTLWTTNTIYLRRNFELMGISEEDIPDIKLWIYHDEDCEIYINGVLAAQTTGYISNYKLLTISPNAQNAFRLNESNTIAVKCTQSWGGQYIDVGLTIEKETSSMFVSDIPPRPEEPVAVEQDSVYLMSYFKGNPQHLFYAYSEDGLVWKDIDYGEPVFDAYNKDIWLRDPYLKRVTHNGEQKFHLVHTWGWDNPAIFHWESTDLITWKAANGGTTTDDGKVYVMDGKNGNASSKNAWAPEFSYDPATETFYIYWSSDMGNGYQKHHYCTTKDWLTFTPSKPYFDPGFTAIDLSILEYNGTYYAFYKDEQGGQKKIRLATSKSLNPDIQAFKGTKEVLSSGYSIEVEGPETFKIIGQNKWLLYWDKFNYDQGISYASSSDPESGKWYQVSDALAQNPSQVKHGSVEIISKTELETLLKHFNKERVTILPTAEIEPQEWKYTTTMPYPGWYKSDFNDVAWDTGRSGFGRGDVGKGIITTPWNNPEIYLRKKFHVGILTDDERNNLFLRICHDDDATIYINGINAMTLTGNSTIYRSAELKESVKNSIRENGENIIAIKCIDKGGVQFIDAGLQTYKSTASSIRKKSMNPSDIMFYNEKEQSLNIHWQETISDSILQINDIQGNIVFEAIAKEKNKLSALSPGMYIATLKDHSKNKISSAKFIK